MQDLSRVFLVNASASKKERSRTKLISWRHHDAALLQSLLSAATHLSIIFIKFGLNFAAVVIFSRRHTQSRTHEGSEIYSSAHRMCTWTRIWWGKSWMTNTTSMEINWFYDSIKHKIREDWGGRRRKESQKKEAEEEIKMKWENFPIFKFDLQSTLISSRFFSLLFKLKSTSALKSA